MFVTSKEYGDFVADFSNKAKGNDDALKVLMMTAYENMVSCSQQGFNYSDVSNPQEYASKATESMKTQVGALLEVAEKRLKEEGIEIPKVEETSYLFKNESERFVGWSQEEARLFAAMKAFQALKPDSEIDRIEQWRMGKNFEMDLHRGKDTVRYTERPFFNDAVYKWNGAMFLNIDRSLKNTYMPMSDADVERIRREMRESGLHMQGTSPEKVETPSKTVENVERTAEEKEIRALLPKDVKDSIDNVVNVANENVYTYKERKSWMGRLADSIENVGNTASKYNEDVKNNAARAFVLSISGNRVNPANMPFMARVLEAEVKFLSEITVGLAGELAKEVAKAIRRRDEGRHAQVERLANGMTVDNRGCFVPRANATPQELAEAERALNYLGMDIVKGKDGELVAGIPLTAEQQAIAKDVKSFSEINENIKSRDNLQTWERISKEEETKLIGKIDRAFEVTPIEQVVDLPDGSKRVQKTFRFDAKEGVPQADRLLALNAMKALGVKCTETKDGMDTAGTDGAIHLARTTLVGEGSRAQYIGSEVHRWQSGAIGKMEKASRTVSKKIENTFSVLSKKLGKNSAGA